ncbi:MAG: cupin, partial [Gammaproteobacteria bacterium]|nr:cupin [Gammaproteobacteria bacterium]
MSNRLWSPAMDPASIAPRTGTSYPKEHREQVERRSKRALGDALGLAHYGVNLVELEPGAWS